jgi:sec-independent protein translocase protein TatA
MNEGAQTMFGLFQLPGGGEWIIILFIALLVFGSRLPAVMRSLGKGVSEFKRGVREIGEDSDADAEPDAVREPNEALKG